MAGAPQANRDLQLYKATAPGAAEPPPSTLKVRICPQIQAEAKKAICFPPKQF